MRGHDPVTIPGFKGKYVRGHQESCPLDHCSSEANLQFTANGIRSRDGFSTFLDTGRDGKRILRLHAVYFQPQVISFAETPAQTRLLILFDDGKLFDSAVGFTTPIYTWVSADVTDFSVQVMFNRVYISPHRRISGATLDNLLVYDPLIGDTTARNALGVQPGPNFGSITSPNAGNVDAGQYVLACAWEYASGFISPPGPFIVQNRDIATAPGAKAFTVAGIPLGGEGVIGRYILSSKVFSAITGDIDAYELFFVPNGHIADNTTTSLDINYYSTELVDSAEYLKSLKTEQKGFIGMCEYNGRLVGWGQRDSKDVIWMSSAGKPENFDATSGFLLTVQDAGDGVKKCVPFRGNLMLHKSRKTLLTRDNESEPAVWETIDIDNAIGTEIYGVGEVLTGDGSTTESYLIADRSGLIIYNGAFQQPPLTWKIDDFWNPKDGSEGVNNTFFDRIQVKVDSILKRIYIIFSLSNNTTKILFADYNLGLDYKSIRWSEWTYPQSDNIVDTLQIILAGTLMVAGEIQANAGTILVPHLTESKIGVIGIDDEYVPDAAAASDYGAAIGWKYKSAYAGGEGVQHFSGIQARLYAPINLDKVQTVDPSIINQEEAITYSLATIKSSDGSGNRINSDKEALANVKESKVAVQLTPAAPINVTIDDGAYFWYPSNTLFSLQAVVPKDLSGYDESSKILSVVKYLGSPYYLTASIAAGTITYNLHKFACPTPSAILASWSEASIDDSTDLAAQMIVLSEDNLPADTLFIASKYNIKRWNGTTLTNEITFSPTQLTDVDGLEAAQTIGRITLGKKGINTLFASFGQRYLSKYASDNQIWMRDSTGSWSSLTMPVGVNNFVCRKIVNHYNGQVLFFGAEYDIDEGGIVQSTSQGIAISYATGVLTTAHTIGDKTVDNIDIADAIQVGLDTFFFQQRNTLISVPTFLNVGIYTAGFPLDTWTDSIKDLKAQDSSWDNVLSPMFLAGNSFTDLTNVIIAVGTGNKTLISSNGDVTGTWVVNATLPDSAANVDYDSTLINEICIYSLYPAFVLDALRIYTKPMYAFQKSMR